MIKLINNETHYLTPIERKTIKAIIDAGYKQAHTKFKRYEIEPISGNQYAVKIWSFNVKGWNNKATWDDKPSRYVIEFSE